MKAISNYKAQVVFLGSLILSLIIINNSESKNIPPINESEYRFFTAEKRPIPVGGNESMIKKIIYPESAMKTRTEGMVYLLVFINEKGNVDAVKIVKGIGAGCDEVAADAVKNTKFVSGMDNGMAVKAKFPVVVNFKFPG